MSNYSTFTDQKLAELLRIGDHMAFTEIYNRFFGLLYIHAVRRLNDEDEASDLIQELFTSIWDKRNSFLLSGSLSSYLYTSIRNRMLNNFEHKKVADKYIESLAGYEDLDYTYADHKIRERDLRKLIEKEIDHLPEPMRQIFLMSRMEHLSHKEIAEKLDVSEQAVKSHVKRALKILRVKLGLYGFLLCLFKLL